MGQVQRDSIERLRHAKKYSGFFGSICTNMAWTGYVMGTGALRGPDPREIAKADVVVAGHQVKAEEQVFMSYAAANRDPDEYADPHTVDLRRDNIRHFSFGVGPHRCIGSHIARMELRILLETLFEMAPDYKLVDDGVRLAADIGTIAGFEQIKITV